MSDKTFRQITIVGVGLLGGSAGLAIKAYDPETAVYGVGRRQSSLDEALEVGAIDQAFLEVAPAVEKTDLVILATPVGAYERLLRPLGEALPADAMVTDVGSTKAAVVRTAERALGRGGPFVGSHPMAGSEQKGATFARADLFRSATCILTPTRHTPLTVTEKVQRFWQALGMRVTHMGPAAHDRALARVSHLPHAIASLLMLLPANADLEVAATGFRDTTRLASGDPEMWRDIFLTNRTATVGAIERFIDSLQAFRDLVAQGDDAAIEAFFSKAKKRRDALIAKLIEDRRLDTE